LVESIHEEHERARHVKRSEREANESARQNDECLSSNDEGMTNAEWLSVFRDHLLEVGSPNSKA